MNNLESTAITLVSEDGIKFEISHEILKNIGLFKNILELNCEPPSCLQVPNVSSLILDKIVEYLENYTCHSKVTRKQENRKIFKSTTTTTASKLVNDDDDDEDYSEDREKSCNSKDFDSDSDDFSSLDFTDGANLRVLTPFEQSFFASLDIPTLIEITKVKGLDKFPVVILFTVKAANFLFIPILLDSCCKAIANHMKGLSVEELRAKFNIRNDFTPEEEDRVKRETAWIDG